MSTPPAIHNRLAIAAAVAALVALPVVSRVVAAPTTQAVDPYTHETPEAEAVNVKLTKDLGAISSSMTGEVMCDPQKRAEVAKTMMPMIDRAFGEADALARLDPNMKATMVSMKRSLVVDRAAFGDADAMARIQADTTSPDAEVAAAAKVDVLRVQWTQAGTDAAKLAPIIQDALDLSKTYPANNGVTGLLLSLSTRAASPETKTQLRDSALAMTSSLAKHMKLSAEGDTKLNSKTGKPLVLAGKTPDGQDFTTDSFKGKVVLVDFWATWCGPCKAELPRVKDMYKTYHDKGLEVIGVSNDYSAKALTTYTAENNLPWPQLFNAESAADHEWNPITNDMGIGGIPVMVLIDKKGVCRSVTARDNLEKLVRQLLAEPG